MSPNDGKVKVNVLKASRILQAKVGSGPLDEEVVAKCQVVMDETKVDFMPLALEYLDTLEKKVEEARKSKDTTEETIQSLINPIMQIKANAAMFNYPLIGNMANIILNFLEALPGCDKDVLDIVNASRKTLKLIVANQMKGLGGEYGTELEKELKDACKRYFRKYAEKGISANDDFFVD